MSLEKQIETLNGNLARLIVLLENPAVVVPAADLPVRNDKPQADAAGAKTPSADTAKAPTAAPANEASANTGTGGIPYDEVKAAVLQLVAKRGKDAALAVLKTFGVANAQQLPVEKYVAARDAVLAALKAQDAA